MDLMSTITSKGQTTIPRKVRDALGLGPRQRIVYQIHGDNVRIRSAGGSLMAVAGALTDDKPALGHKQERASYRKAREKRYKTSA